jgi:hypothetical protein
VVVEDRRLCGWHVVKGVGCAPFGIAVLSQEVALDFKKELVLGLVGEHVLPSFVFRFDAAEADFGGFTDLL